MGFSQFIGAFKLSTKKHSPEILFAMGCIGMVATVITACRATIKAEEIFDKREERLSKRQDTIENMPDYTEQDAKDDLFKINCKAGWSLVKNYALPVGLGIASIGCFAGSVSIYKKWFIGMSTAYAAVKADKEKLEKAVRNKLGDEEYEAFKQDEKEKEMVKEFCDPDEDKRHRSINRFFDQGNPNFVKDAEANRIFLQQKINWLNQRLQCQGHLFLNEFYEDLGYEKTKAGQVLGWMAKKPDGSTNYIDIGLFDVRSDSVKRFHQGIEYVFEIIPNVDGNILDRVNLFSY